MIAFVVAMDRNRGIGLHNKLPWRLPEDMRFFRRVTTGHTILMGRKTYESIGRPLPDRTNVVLSRDPAYRPEGVIVLHSLEEVLERYGSRGSGGEAGLEDAGVPGHGDAADEDLYVIGGADIFKLLMPAADKMIVTRIDHEFEADTFFPSLREEDWTVASRTPGIKNEENPYDYEFVIYERN